MDFGGKHLGFRHFFFQIPFSAFVSDSSYPYIRNYTKVMAEYRRFAMRLYFGQRDSHEVAESILDALLTRPKFGDHLNRSIVRWSNHLIRFTRQTAALPLASYSNRKLWDVYREHDRIHTKLYTYGWLPVAVDMFHNNLTDKLKQYLYSVCPSKTAAEAAFILFTTPTSKTIVAREQEELLAIVQRFRGAFNKSSPALVAALKRHRQRWVHLSYIYAGNTQPFGIDDYLKQLRTLAKTGVNPSTSLAKAARQLQQTARKQRRLYRQLRVAPVYRRLFRVSAAFAVTKLFRRHGQLFTLYQLHQTLLPVIAGRLQLTRYQVQFMLKDEVRQGLLLGRVNRRELKERLRRCVVYGERDVEVVFTRKAANRLIRQLRQSTGVTVNELHGQTANPGTAKGRVKIIIRAKDMAKMQRGDILVSIATDPDIVPAMKLAAAIVTEQGGITSHAAIVSRELGIPCVIGTKVATQLLKDGDRVEVDATRGVVRKVP